MPYFTKPAKRVSSAISPGARAILARTAAARAPLDKAVRRGTSSGVILGTKREGYRRQGPLKRPA